MDESLLVWTVVNSIGTLALGGIGIWAAVIAHKANGRVDQANKTADHANKIAAEALEAQKLVMPPTWSEAEMPSKSDLRFRNTSGKDLVVLSVSQDPDGFYRFDPAVSTPITVEYGDTFKIAVLRAGGFTPPTVTLTWHYADDPTTTHETKRTVR